MYSRVKNERETEYGLREYMKKTFLFILLYIEKYEDRF